jgi:hypothetical protein
MTVSLKHTFQSAKTDSLDATLVQPSNWNQEHQLTLATNKVLGRATAGTGAAEEISIGTALSVSGGTLAVTNVPVANGGTGASTLTGYVKGNGTSAFTAAATVPVGDISGTLPVASGGTGAATLTANNVLLGNGTSAIQAVAPGTAGNVLTSNGTTWTSATPLTSGTFDAVASGTLSNGSTVIINVDGTVSAVANQTQSIGTSTNFDGTVSDGFLYISAIYDANAQKVVIVYADRDNPTNYGTAIVGTVSGTSISFGTAVVFNLANTAHIAPTYDATTQKIVIAYQNGGNSSFGTAIVGTVSGTSISFGTAVVFESAITDNIAATYDSVQQKVVLAYRDQGNSLFGTAIVGTVSGTSISFGTAVVFESANTDATSATYDVNAQKIVVAYRDNGNSSFTTAAVGTVSGTSISFGTPVVVNSAIPDGISITYDASALKVVIFFTDGSNIGAARVGTVSGTSISVGTAVVFASAGTFQMSATYDAFVQKVVVAYRNQGNSNAGTFIVGTVSGTSISFATAVVFDSNDISNTGTKNYAVYDSVNRKVVFAYQQTSGGGATKLGKAIVVQVAFQNITSENFIGFSNAAYTNGQTATIQIAGAVDDAQSGLTPGQSYFVQLNGTLGLTAASPSVFAGTAVATNKIIVKG